MTYSALGEAGSWLGRPCVSFAAVEASEPLVRCMAATKCSTSCRRPSGWKHPSGGAGSWSFIMVKEAFLID